MIAELSLEECPRRLRELGDRAEQEFARFDREVARRLTTLALRVQAFTRPGSRLLHARSALWHRACYRVEHMFIIQSGSGLLLDHLSTQGAADIDVDAVAGMLTAIEHFVQDSMATAGGVGLGAATVGEYRLLISHGPLARVAVFVRGAHPRDLVARLDRLNEALHACHGYKLADSPVMADRGGYIHSRMLSDLSERGRRARDRERGLRWLAALGSAAVFGLAALSSPALFRAKSGGLESLATAIELHSHRAVPAWMYRPAP